MLVVVMKSKDSKLQYQERESPGVHLQLILEHEMLPNNIVSKPSKIVAGLALVFSQKLAYCQHYA